MKRHNKFSDIPGMDSELNLILKQVEELTGKIVKDLPPKQDTPELSVFHIKQTDGSWKHYKKLDGEFVEI